MWDFVVADLHPSSLLAAVVGLPPATLAEEPLNPKGEAWQVAATQQAPQWRGGAESGLKRAERRRFRA